MWGNLNNVRSMAAKIGNVVAPPPDDGDEYDDDEGSDEYEDYDDDDGEYSEEEEVDPQPRSPFGLANMFAQALDSGQKQQRPDDHEDADESDPDSSAHEDPPPSLADDIAEKVPENGVIVEPKLDAVEPIAHESPVPRSQPKDAEEKDQVLVTSPSSRPAESNAHSPIRSPSIRVDKKEIMESPASSPPMIKTLVRESGSLSPKRVQQKLGPGSLPPVRSLGTKPSGEKVSLSPLRQVVEEKKQMFPIDLDGEDPKQAWEAPEIPTPPLAPTEQDSLRMEKLEKRCKELKRQLEQANEKVAELKSCSQQPSDNTNDTEKLLQTFQEKEACLLQAAEEEHGQEMIALKTEMNEKVAELQAQLMEERNGFSSDRDQMQRMLSESAGQMESLQQQLQVERNQRNQDVSQREQNHMRALRLTEDKLAQSMATVDEREDTIGQLRKTLSALEAKMKEHRAGAEEADEEIDELHNENEHLHHQVETLKNECESLKASIAELEGDSDQLLHLKMEIRLLKEDRDRAAARVEDMTASAKSNNSQLEADRDDAMAAARDLQLQLSAALADVSVAKADTDRVVMSNENLQAALEAFQSERETEMALVEEQRKNQEATLEAAHKAAMAAMKEVQLTEMKLVQQAADAAVKNSMDDIQQLEEKVEMLRKENLQTRRALDEAISRLQLTQDDVVDRTFMKNILLDWLTKNGKKERSQVLQVMADLLHFTDDEKRRVRIDERNNSSRNLLPPAKADLENLEGDNVQEKWVNFLIAEAED